MVILLAIPLSLAAGALVSAACARAVLTPDDRRFFHLRFSRTELWLMPIQLCLIIGYVLCIGGGMVALIAIMRVFAGSLGAAGGFLGFLVGLAFWQGLLWLFLRFSFSVPMTVRDARPHLLASWGQTRGVGWKLVGLVWLLILFAIVAALGFGLVIGMVGIAVAIGGAAGGSPEQFAAMADSPVVLAVEAVIGALLGGYLTAIFVAPVIDAYRQAVGVVGAEEVF